LFISLWGEEKGVEVTWDTIFHKIFLNKSLTKIYLCKFWFLYNSSRSIHCVTKCTVVM